MDKEEFLEKVKELEAQIMFSRARKSIKLQLEKVCQDFGYMYTPFGDTFLPVDGVNVFEFMIVGCDLKTKEAILRKSIFRISDETADIIEKDFIFTESSQIKHNALHALYTGLDSCESLYRKLLDIPFKVLLKSTDGKITEDYITGIKPPRRDDVIPEKMKKFLGEVNFTFPNGMAYFSCYKVSVPDYDTIMSDESRSKAFAWARKGFPEDND